MSHLCAVLHFCTDFSMELILFCTQLFPASLQESVLAGKKYYDMLGKESLGPRHKRCRRSWRPQI